MTKYGCTCTQPDVIKQEGVICRKGTCVPMTLNFMSLSIHVPIFDVPNVPQIQVPFNLCPICHAPEPIPCPSNSCPFHSMPLYFISLNQLHVPFISCPLSNPMPFKFTSLSFHVPIFDALMSLKLISLSIHVFIFHIPYTISCPSNSHCLHSISLYLMSMMYLKFTSLLIHVPIFHVPDVPQSHVPFNPCSYISCPLIKIMSLSHVPFIPCPYI